jgi:hypothetical protein
VYSTGVTPSAIRTFHVAKTSRPAIFTLEAARASVKRCRHYKELNGKRNIPFAFLLDIIDARINIGPLRIVPGSASKVQTANRASL